MLRSTYPGTAHHQALLARIVDSYKDDNRILAVCLFGSLTRGTWDHYSDLDLDIVIEDGVQVAVMTELQNLCAAFHELNETALMIVPNGNDSGDIVLQSLTELSIRYHTLQTTSPNIIDSVQLLAGKIEIDAVKAAGSANREALHSINGHDVDRLLRWAGEVNISLQRGQFWQAVRLLQFMRETLIEIFAWSRGYPRAYHAFEAQANETLKSHIGKTLPNYNLESVQDALSEMLRILEGDLDILSDGQLYLTHRRTG